MKNKILLAIITTSVALLIGVYFIVNSYQREVSKEETEDFVDLEELYKDYEDITPDKIKETKIYKKLTFSNGQIIKKNNNAIFKVTITNETDEDIALGPFKIILKNEKGDIITSFTGYAGDIIAKGYSVGPYIPFNTNIDEVYDVEYE